VPAELWFLPEENPANNTARLKVSPADMLKTTSETHANLTRDTQENP
jgi:hypothetical protein